MVAFKIWAKPGIRWFTSGVSWVATSRLHTQETGSLGAKERRFFHNTRKTRPKRLGTGARILSLVIGRIELVILADARTLRFELWRTVSSLDAFAPHAVLGNSSPHPTEDAQPFSPLSPRQGFCDPRRGFSFLEDGPRSTEISEVAPMNYLHYHSMLVLVLPV